MMMMMILPCNKDNKVEYGISLKKTQQNKGIFGTFWKHLLLRRVNHTDKKENQVFLI